MTNPLPFNPQHLIKLAHYKMPYGKYKNRYLSDLPEYYLAWYSQKGFPQNELGRFLQEVYELQQNGLEYLLKKIRNS